MAAYRWSSFGLQLDDSARVVIYRKQAFHKTAKKYQLDLFDPDTGTFDVLPCQLRLAGALGARFQFHSCDTDCRAGAEIHHNCPAQRTSVSLLNPHSAFPLDQQSWPHGASQWHIPSLDVGICPHTRKHFTEVDAALRAAA